MENRKRYIGVIPYHESRNRGYLEELRNVILPSWNIIPATSFYHISYAKLLRACRSGASYDIVICSRLKDDEGPEVNNLYAAASELRFHLGLPTIFVISFNELLAKVRGIDLKAEKQILEKFSAHENDPGRKPIGGIVRTTSTDPTFLISILSDVLEGPHRYLEKKEVYAIETQAHFIYHPPGFTQRGIG